MTQAHDNAGLQRKKDPNAGAVSQYYGITSPAIRNIEAGSELTIECVHAMRNTVINLFGI